MKIISDGFTGIANFRNDSNSQKGVVLNAVNTIDVRKNYYQRRMLSAQESSTILPAVVLCGILGASPYIKSKGLALGASLASLAVYGFQALASQRGDNLVNRLSEKEALQSELDSNNVFAYLDKSQEAQKQNLMKEYRYRGFNNESLEIGRFDLGFIKFNKEVKNKERNIKFPEPVGEATIPSELVTNIFNKINKKSEKYKNNVCTGIGLIGLLNTGLLLGVQNFLNKGKYLKSGDRRMDILSFILCFAAIIPVSTLTSPKFQSNLDSVSRFKAKNEVEKEFQGKVVSKKAFGIITDTYDYILEKKNYKKLVRLSEKNTMLSDAAVKEIELSSEQQKEAKEIRSAFLDSVKRKGVYNLNKTNFISNMFFNAALLPIIYYIMTKACQQGFSMNKYIKQALMSVGAVSALASLTYSTTKTDLK